MHSVQVLHILLELVESLLLNLFNTSISILLAKHVVPEIKRCHRNFLYFFNNLRLKWLFELMSLPRTHGLLFIVGIPFTNSFKPLSQSFSVNFIALEAEQTATLRIKERLIGLGTSLEVSDIHLIHCGCFTKEVLGLSLFFNVHFVSNSPSLVNHATVF